MATRDWLRGDSLVSDADGSLTVDWINADRSHRGNAHYNRNGEISRADAWLMIHVAGALMVRLSDEEPRDIKAAQEHRQAEAEKVRQAELAAAAQGASEETDLNGYNWSSGSREDPPF
ncbi:hypothetical protein [Arthrobacter sp. H14]|uniref:hypothetical protein n=1 Tax=Arthrobacter sp. H14 TaxID=1312959 RepID=UPI00047A8671|nr:hypothetical protein [Arthrobacter sp. H14]